jgi:hypothetical protein
MGVGLRGADEPVQPAGQRPVLAGDPSMWACTGSGVASPNGSAPELPGVWVVIVASFRAGGRVSGGSEGGWQASGAMRRGSAGDSAAQLASRMICSSAAVVNACP